MINSAARTQFVRPPKFSKPRELPRSFTTKRPITTRRTTKRTTQRPIDTTTTEDIFDYDDDEDVIGRQSIKSDLILYDSGKNRFLATLSKNSIYMYYRGFH